jgi:5-methylcytosine-specific restriction endonuclease McrA
MSKLKPRQPRVRLGPEAYDDLRKKILARDNWHCQNCGAVENLQVHHIRSRSRLGDDSRENLITLCAICHESLHRNRPPSSSGER